MAQKFIIITTARSGSQMFCEFLDKQVNIRCELELLQSHKERKFRDGCRGNLEVFNQFCKILGEDSSKFVGNRNRRFREFLEIWENVVPSKYFGFKVFFKNHLGTTKLPLEDSISYKDFLQYIKDNNIKIIHLTRNNLLLKYISVKTSLITDVYSSSSTSEINSISIEVIYKDFINWRDKNIEEEQNVVNFLNNNGINYHHVTYENLIGKEYVSSYKDILEFLGEDPNLFIDIKETPIQNKKKINIFPLRHKVSNLDQLVEEATKANDTELLDIINIELTKD
jgi:LPS sulfotransferase NodH